MKKLMLLLFIVPSIAFGQPNCNVFLWNKDTLQYEACQFVEEHKNDYYQFDRRQIAIWEEAIAICPYFAFPYREIAAPYVKSGHFLKWKENIDKAVQYAPTDYLSVRASLRYKFFADYTGAIEDINRLDSLLQDVGYTSNGTYHLNIVRGLCYKALGQTDEAIYWIEHQTKKEDASNSLFDYLHLAVLYLEQEEPYRAIDLLQQQNEINVLAENYYYLAKAHLVLQEKEKAKTSLKQALNLYKAGKKMFDPYNELFDQVYLIEIETALETLGG